MSQPSTTSQKPKPPAGGAAAAERNLSLLRYFPRSTPSMSATATFTFCAGERRTCSRIRAGVDGGWTGLTGWRCDRDNDTQMGRRVAGWERFRSRDGTVPNQRLGDKPLHRGRRNRFESSALISSPAVERVVLNALVLSAGRPGRA